MLSFTSYKPEPFKQEFDALHVLELESRSVHQKGMLCQ